MPKKSQGCREDASQHVFSSVGDLLLESDTPNSDAAAAVLSARRDRPKQAATDGRNDPIVYVMCRQYLSSNRIDNEYSSVEELTEIVDCAYCATVHGARGAEPRACTNTAEPEQNHQAALLGLFDTKELEPNRVVEPETLKRNEVVEGQRPRVQTSALAAPLR